MKFRTIISTALIIAVIGAIIAYKIYNKPHRDIASAAPDFSMSADALYAAFELDEEKANYNYLDKIIEVDGNIEEVSTNADGFKVYSLSAAGALIGGVSATISSQADQETFNAGDKVTLKCRCTGFLMDVVLVDCSIVNQGGK